MGWNCNGSGCIMTSKFPNGNKGQSRSNFQLLLALRSATGGCIYNSRSQLVTIIHLCEFPALRDLSPRKRQMTQSVEFGTQEIGMT
jgi:hypothetical protein